MNKFFNPDRLTIYANIISRVLDIDIVITIILLICLFYSIHSSQNPILWFFVFLLFLVIIPSAGALFLIKTKRVSDWDLSIRKERAEYITLETMLRLILLVITYLSNAPLIFKVTILILFVIEFVYSFVTMFWKISIHAQLVTLLSCYSIVFGGLRFAFVLLFLPLIFFARLTLKKHDIWQLLAGSGVTFVICLAILKIFRYY